MGIGTILSHGIGSYFNTKNAMDDRAALEERRKREAEQFQAWRQDRARAESDRNERDVWYKDASDLTTTAPSFTEQSDIANQPAEERQQSGAVPMDGSVTPEGGINQGNGVTSFAYGVNPSEPLNSEALPDSPAAPKSEPWTNAPVGQHTPMPGNTVEPIAPISLADFIAKHGIKSEAQKPAAQPAASKQNALDYSGLVAARDKLNALRLRAVKIRDPQAIAYLNEQGANLIGQWAASFPGDPTADPLNYARHLGQVNAVFGKPLTPEEASGIYAAQRAYDAEGANAALKAAHAGDKAGALKAYEKGKHRFSDIELIPAKSAAGLPSYNIVATQADGSKVNLGNAFDAMIAMAGADAQLKAFVDQRKLENETRKTGAEVKLSDAKADYYGAGGRMGKAGAAPSQVRTAEWLVEMGVASDYDEAWRMVGTSKAKSREAAIQDMTAKILAGGTIRRVDDALKAATQIVDGTVIPETADPTQQAPSTSPTNQGSPRARFEADPQMRGLKMGKVTGHGWEVLDPSGRLIGHWK